MPSSFATIYELLDQVRERPAMYCGENSLSHLQAFLQGLSFANLSPGEPDFWSFSKWVTVIVPGIGAANPWGWLENRLGRDAAVERFFELLDRYRECRDVTLQRHDGPFVAGFKTSESPDFEPRTPKVPVALAIHQYEPTEIYFLREHYADGSSEDEWPLPSFERVREQARSKWAAEDAGWNVAGDVRATTMPDLGDDRWAQLTSGYRRAFDVRPLLRRVLAGDDSSAWQELWEELYHQGDIGTASLAVVPHLVRVHAANELADWNTYAFVGAVELVRGVDLNPDVPAWLDEAYRQAWQDIVPLALQDLEKSREPSLVTSALGVIALARGSRLRAKVLLTFTDDELEDR